MKTIQTGKVQKVSLKNEGPLKNMMTAPIIGNNNQILGAIQIVNKKPSGDGQDLGFNKHDAKVLSVLCAHIASFIEIVQAYPKS